MNMRATLSAAADAAALATARDPDITPQNMQQRAEAFFLANTQNNAFGLNYTVSAQELPGGDGVHVSITAQIDTTLMSLAGVNHFNVSAQSEAVYNSNKVELALVLDNTGSMRRSRKIQTLRAASHDMIDLLLPNGPPSENVKVSIVPFDIGVNVGTQNQTQNWMQFHNTGYAWKGCVGPRGNNHDVNDSSATGAAKIPAIYGDQTSCNIASILPLSNEKTVLHDKVDAMRAVGWTYIPEGLAWGWRTLSPDAPYAEGVAYSDPDWQKVLVLMTDGANTVKWNWAGGWPSANTGVSSTVGNNKTRVLCDRIKLSNIIVYTVAFKVYSNSTRNMLEDCASTPNHYFDAQNNAALEAAFAKIGGEINNLRLSK
jgi:Mg-chelatase subunit ChlD